MMYSLKDFVNYNGEKLSDNHAVLVYSKRDGYFFTTYQHAIKLDYKICGMEKA